MENKTEYIALLKKALAAETETVRLYVALMALAPEKDVPKFLELNADETDHQAIIADLLLGKAQIRSSWSRGWSDGNCVLRSHHQP